MPSFAELHCDLRLMPANWSAALRAVFACMIGVTGLILILDAVVFRHQLAASYVAYFTSPLMPRLAVICMMAACEEVKYRLLLMTVLVIMATAMLGKLKPWQWLTIIVLVQFVNVGGAVLADPLYASLRYWLVGSVWGWLYWKHGVIAAVAGHSATHLLLDPALKFALLATG